MDRILTRVLFAVLGCTQLLAVSHAHPVLAFVEQTVTSPAKDSKEKPTREEFPVTVVLGDHYVSTESQGTRRILDFEHRRLYRLDLNAHTFEDDSLFIVFGFNAMELQNRIAMNRMLLAAKLNDAAESNTPALMEHLFSLRADGQNTVIDSAHSGDATVYRFKTTELLSISDKSRPLPAGSQAQYWRWLRYTAGGHPQIYADLEKRTGVPELLRVSRWQKPADQIVTLRLTSVTNAADAPYSLAGFTRAPAKEEPFLTLEKVGRDSSAKLAAVADATQRDRDTAMAQGKMLDAMLANFAYMLSTGDNDPTWLVHVKDQVSADADARALAGALNASSAEQAEAAVKTLTALQDKSTSSYAYLLSVFAANHEIALKHGKHAQELFLAALSRNPYLTGAWIDLGQFYYVSFNTREAWACWDAVRAINSSYAQGKQVDAMEAKMVADHPEFF